MKLKPKICTLLLVLFAHCMYGQMGRFDYKREIKGIHEQWHKVVLPDELFERVNNNLSDIRLYGITPENDTIEAPYLLKVKEEKVQDKEIDCKIQNTSFNEKGYYFTVEIPVKEPVNQIKPEFKNSNFDWKIQLQASQDQKEWFTLASNYRILSIHNSLADYKFTRIALADAAYRYFRMHLSGKEKPELLSVKVSRMDTLKGELKNYPIRKVKITEPKEEKQTWVELDLSSRVPVSWLKVHVKDSIDYFRPITIEYLSDSTQTQTGWRYNYRILGSGTLSSMQNNEFTFPTTLLKKVRVMIGNQDNEPLSIERVEAKGPVHELIGRFTNKASYFLVYGNRGADAPVYDLVQFTDKIPSTLSAVELGKEQTITKHVTLPLFQNKAWLWVIMGIIIALLGWYTVGMIKKQ